MLRISSSPFVWVAFASNSTSFFTFALISTCRDTVPLNVSFGTAVCKLLSEPRHRSNICWTCQSQRYDFQTFKLPASDIRGISNYSTAADIDGLNKSHWSLFGRWRTADGRFIITYSQRCFGFPASSVFIHDEIFTFKSYNLFLLSRYSNGSLAPVFITSKRVT
jgi:hypothetical protein